MTERTLTLDGIEIQATQFGAGPPLIWLHGYASRPGEEAFLQRLATGRRVMAPVHPGFGEAGRLPWIRSMEDLAFYYRYLIEQLAGGEPVTLAGHSLGGWIASEVAIRFAHLLRGLVLLAPFGLRREDVPPADIFMLADAERRERAWHNLDLAPAAGPSSLAAIRDLEMTAQLGWEPRLFGPRLAERLRWIDVPTLLVWGSKDRIIPVAYAQTWAELVPGAATVIIPDAGHYVHIEQPDACAVAIAGSAAGADRT